MTAVDLPLGAPPVPALAGGTTTVVVPTFNEAGNVAELLRQLETALPHDGSYDVLFVDDSTDGTPDVVRALAPAARFPVAVLHRDEPVGGLGGAVVAGLRATHADWVVVMDGDLQHPPHLVPVLVQTGRDDDADVVVATRYSGGGSSDGLAGSYRHVVSRFSTSITRSAFPRRLAGVSDPMSGFFAVRREAVVVDELRPSGFKILLELVVRARVQRVAEVPFDFGERHAGESKSSLAEGLRFLRHLAALRAGSSRASRSVAFALVGLSGVLPNLAVLWALASHLGLHYLLAAVLSTQVAIIWNFALLELVVFTGERRWRRRHRLLSFVLLNNLDLALRVPLLALLVEHLGWSVLPATAATLLAAFAFRFLASDRLIYVPRAIRTASTDRPAPVPVVEVR